MKPYTQPYERRLFKRLHMANHDCRLTLIRVRSGRRERETCILVDLSYGGLRFRAFRPVEEDELLEFLVRLGSPAHRSGSVAARVCTTDSNEYDCYVEFLEASKGLLEPYEKSLWYWWTLNYGGPTFRSSICLPLATFTITASFVVQSRVAASSRRSKISASP
jgi:hypothetical protein